MRASLHLARDDTADVFMNATQNAYRCSAPRLLPALITNSHVWSMKHQRLLLECEMFEVQGFAMFPKSNLPHHYMAPFRKCILQDLSAEETLPLPLPEDATPSQPGTSLLDWTWSAACDGK